MEVSTHVCPESVMGTVNWGQEVCLSAPWGAQEDSAARVRIQAMEAMSPH